MDINLLPTSNLDKSAKVVFRRQITLVVGFVSLLVVLEIIFSFAVNMVLNNQITGLENKRDSLKASLDQNLQVATDLRTVTEKVTGIEAVRASRQDFSTAVIKIKEVVGQGIDLISFDVGSQGTVSLLARAPTPESLDIFLTQAGSLKNVVLTGLRQDAGTSFSFRLTGEYDFKK